MIKNTYYKIKDPETNKIYTINSKFGKSILKNYLLMLNGGTNPEKNYLTDLDSGLKSFSSDTDFSFIRPSKIISSMFIFLNLSEENNKYYYQNNNLLDKILVTNDGYLELHPEYSEINEMIELSYLANNSKIKKKNLFIKNLIKFNEYPNWNIINYPNYINPLVNPRFNSPLIHKIDSSRYLSGIYGYEYYKISGRDDTEKKILFLWDFHTTFYTPPSSETIDILELIDHYVRKCELNKNCLDIFIEEPKDIGTNMLQKVEKHGKSELIGGTTKLSSKDDIESMNMEKDIVDLIISILKTFSENTIYLDYITRIDNEFKKYNRNFNGNNIFQLVPYIYTYYSQKSLGKDNKINYIKMIELINNNLNHTVISNLVNSSHIQDRTIIRMILKGKYSWRRANGVRVHHFDISQQTYGYKTTKAFYLNNHEDLNKLIIEVMRTLMVYSKGDLVTYFTKFKDIDICDTNGSIYNLRNNNDKKSLYLYCISSKDNDSENYSYERGKMIAEKILDNRKNLMKEISDKYTPETQQFLKSYESYVLNDLLFQYLNFKTQHQIDNIDEHFFTKKQLVSYMLQLIETYPIDKLFLGAGGVRLFITETYAIARMFRIFDSTKNRVENCDTNDNSLKNIIYFAGGAHTEITSNFIKTILEIEPISSDNVFNNPASKYLQNIHREHSLPRYLNLDGTNFFFKNSNSVIEKPKKK